MFTQKMKKRLLKKILKRLGAVDMDGWPMLPAGDERVGLEANALLLKKMLRTYAKA